MAYNILTNWLSSRETTLLGLFWYSLSALIFIGLGCVNLYYPLGVDQSVVMMGAEALSRGDILYVDYWDNKQPGLYYLYHLGGEFFGYDEFGVHLIELIWMILFAIVLMTTLRPLLHYPWLSSLAPITTIGIYYATAGVYQLSQLEMLVSFPIYISAWFALKATQCPERCLAYCFAGGLAGGIAVLFKLVLAPIIACFWLIAVIYLCMDGRHWFRTGLRLAIPVLLGALVPIALTLLYFWQLGALDEYLWTSLSYPAQAFDTAPPASKSRWITAAAFTTLHFAPWAVFSIIACYCWVKDPKNSLIAMAIAWLAAAIALFFIQSFSWWEYHTLLFFVPIGILAVFGLDNILRIIGDSQSTLKHFRTAVSAVLLIPLCASLTAPFLKKAQPLLSEMWVQGLSVKRYHWLVDTKYRDLESSIQFLFGEDARPGPIYSFGFAGLYAMAERKNPHAIAGSSWEFYLPDQMSDILNTLKNKQVPYIFVDAYDYKIYYMKPDITQFLSRHYDLLKKDLAGTWYIRKHDSGASPEST